MERSARARPTEVSPKGPDRALETEVRDLCERGAFDDAVSLAIRRFGPELLRFLIHAHRDETFASDVFSLVAEDIWRGLPRFRWECTFRTWSYCLAHRASQRQRRRKRADDLVVPIAELGALSELVLAVKTHTISAVRSERRSALDTLRDELEVEERMLLSLRIDRELSWPEIAAVIGDGDAADAATIARLRKRFQLLKDRLKRRGRELGLVPR